MSEDEERPGRASMQVSAYVHDARCVGERGRASRRVDEGECVAVGTASANALAYKRKCDHKDMFAFTFARSKVIVGAGGQAGICTRKRHEGG